MESWKQLSFKENNMRIDRARSFCENHIEKNLEIYTIVIQWKSIGKKIKKEKLLKF